MSEPRIRSYQVQPRLCDPIPGEMRLEEISIVCEDVCSAEREKRGNAGIDKASQGSVVVTHYVLRQIKEKSVLGLATSSKEQERHLLAGK